MKKPSKTHSMYSGVTSCYVTDLIPTISAETELDSETMSELNCPTLCTLAFMLVQTNGMRILDILG